MKRKTVVVVVLAEYTLVKTNYCGWILNILTYREYFNVEKDVYDTIKKKSWCRWHSISWNNSNKNNNNTIKEKYRKR